ncbi:ATP-utilizing enzymes of the PP-loop superfamily [Desulfocucumis palustris]|uniref:ATP-utilizing enzymes of the PP-loop superfamily n=1 Tax=Desulfocucumis palustris TaxID=1898651 RepID=A0A2L2XMI3_9FIRM|nr:ATP-dependent sacrificial sulfur transferase LarE [Desulfocucumis palustris]GBF35161.1 ATP-utilizing enzymes of the PP-loop superfamily [Desulfocucumis palustris]
METLQDKSQYLNKIIKGYGSVLVAFSGGADSTLLLKSALDALGDRVLAVTARSEIYPPGEAEEASEIARSLGAEHLILKTGGLKSPAFAGNPPDRCYHCKKELYEKLNSLARERGLNYVADGVNADDASDYRPGMRAGVEAGVRTPLKQANLTKRDIYALSREMGLPTAHKPANPCLASRFPYGTEITPEALDMVHKSEAFLKSLGYTPLRVRHHGHLARIEVPPDRMESVLRDAERITAAIKTIGYIYVTLDLRGFRSGSMNETLEDRLRLY